MPSNGSTEPDTTYCRNLDGLTGLDPEPASLLGQLWAARAIAAPAVGWCVNPVNPAGSFLVLGPQLPANGAAGALASTPLVSGAGQSSAQGGFWVQLDSVAVAGNASAQPVQVGARAAGPRRASLCWAACLHALHGAAPAASSRHAHARTPKLTCSVAPCLAHPPTTDVNRSALRFCWTPAPPSWSCPPACSPPTPRRCRPRRPPTPAWCSPRCWGRPACRGPAWRLWWPPSRPWSSRWAAAPRVRLCVAGCGGAWNATENRSRAGHAADSLQLAGGGSAGSPWRRRSHCRLPTRPRMA